MVKFDDDTCNDAYLTGLYDAWDLVRKLVLEPDDYSGAFSAEEVGELFDVAFEQVVKNFGILEVLKKVEVYEREKRSGSEYIVVGDVVVSELDNRKFFVTFVDDVSASIIDKKGRVYTVSKNILERTGEYVPEVEGFIRGLKSLSSKL